MEYRVVQARAEAALAAFQEQDWYLLQHDLSERHSRSSICDVLPTG